MSTAMSSSAERFAAIVPIRSWSTGKSRLGLHDSERARLAQAFALDVIDVLKASPDVDRVVVVTSDDDVRLAMDGLDVLPDRGHSLDEAVAQGCAHVLEHDSTNVVVVPSDLPCLSVTALAEVLHGSREHVHAYCPDAEGSGTSLVISRDPASLRTSYGAGSAAAHRASGLVPLLDAPAEARRDVDTLDHLRDAEAIGVGSRTAAVIRDLSTSSRSAG